jgi:hypothetical protein
VRKTLIVLAAVAAVVVAAGAVAWRVASARLLAAVDAQLTGLEAAGIEASVADPRVTGFPLAFSVETGAVRIAAADGAWAYAAPSSVSAVSLLDRRALRTTLPEEGRLTLSPQGAPPIDFAVTGEGVEIETALGPDGAARLTAGSLKLAHAAEAGLRRAEIALERPRVAVDAGPGGALDLAVDADAASVLSEIDEPEGGRSLSDSRFEGFALRLTGSGFGAGDLSRFVAADGSAELTATTRAVTTSFTRAGGPEGPIAVTGRGGPGEGRFRLAGGRVSYTIESAGATYDVDLAGAGAGRGAISTGRAAASFEMPLRRSADPQPYALSVSIDAVAADDALWATVDPGGALPRGPIALAAEIGGQARLLADIGAAAETAAPPVDVRTVEIADLSFRGLGASAAATGALRLEPGAPAPDGSIALRIEGWAPLVDRLEAAALIDAEQAAFVRRLAATFARPGEAEGTLVSEIELLDGAVFANGARVR